jgi:hypothetical protein
MASSTSPVVGLAYSCDEFDRTDVQTNEGAAFGLIDVGETSIVEAETAR